MAFEHGNVKLGLNMSFYTIAGGLPVPRFCEKVSDADSIISPKPPHQENICEMCQKVKEKTST